MHQLRGGRTQKNATCSVVLLGILLLLQLALSKIRDVTTQNAPLAARVTRLPESTRRKQPHDIFGARGVRSTTDADMSRAG